jgi:ribosome maturation factor RimP
MDLRLTLEGLIEPIAISQGLELIQVQCIRTPGRWIVRIFVDRPEGGITLGECASMSREIGHVFEAEDPIGVPYTLEVSSPGLNRPLTRPEHFARFQGGRVSVTTRTPVLGRRRFAGVLESSSEEAGVTLVLDEGERTTLKFSEIAEAHLVVDPWQKRAGGTEKA